MTVSPIHHRRDGETAGEWGGCGGDWGHWGYGIGVAGRWGSLSGMGSGRSVQDGMLPAYKMQDVELWTNSSIFHNGFRRGARALSVGLTNMQKLRYVCFVGERKLRRFANILAQAGPASMMSDFFQVACVTIFNPKSSFRV